EGLFQDGQGHLGGLAAGEQLVADLDLVGQVVLEDRSQDRHVLPGVLRALFDEVDVADVAPRLDGRDESDGPAAENDHCLEAHDVAPDRGETGATCLRSSAGITTDRPRQGHAYVAPTL